MKSEMRGFTLLEVMVAITILAIAAAGISGGLGQSLRQMQTLEQKTFATWVADNRLNEMLAGHIWPNPGTTTDKVAMAGYDWRLRITISDTDNQAMRKIEIAVNIADKADKEPVTVLTGFMGKY